jgi:GDP/UDP-N,N'-diacetylbacillosamine 2-epimerase (hydrolysing)
MIKLCVVTGSRGDYDLLYPLIKIFKESKKIKLNLFVTGSHLKKKFGFSKKYIINDGFEITEEISILNKNFNSSDVSNYFSVAIKKFSNAFLKNSVDLLIVLGDRYEIFSAVLAASFHKIPVAHIAGGESTSGTIDESIRHSITKFSHIHFAANKFYKKRIIQLGENPKNVYNVGSTSLDNIKNIKLYNKSFLSKELKINFLKKNFLVTFHPSLYSKKDNVFELKNLLSALSLFKNHGIFITLPNADIENDRFNKLIFKFTRQNSNVKVFSYLGRKLYFSLANEVDLIIGNSSSGIIEIPYLRKITINIGNRQEGRIMDDCIINCSASKKDILISIKKGLSENFKNKKKFKSFFYGKGNSSKKIFNILKTKYFNNNLSNLLTKKFYNL